MSVPGKMFVDGHLGGYIQGGDLGTWCPNLWRWAVEEFRIQSVLDLGCGEGFAARAFRDLGCRPLGIDGCAQAIRDSVAPECVLQHDFVQGAFVAPEPIDMIWTCEFLEHVEEVYVPNILKTLSQATKVILVTYGLPHQRNRGHHHVNCQPSSYWIERIEQLGYVCDVARTMQARTISLRDYHSINHFAQSGLVFVKQPVAPRIASLLHRIASKMKEWRIDWGFRCSWAYQQRQWRRRMVKRGLLANRTESV